MCREYSCPCLDYVSQDGRSSLEEYRKANTYLEAHGRSVIDKDSDGFMYFVKMEKGKDEIGFKSMEHCLGHRFAFENEKNHDLKVSGKAVAENITQVLIQDAKLIASRV